MCNGILNLSSAMARETSKDADKGPTNRRAEVISSVSTIIDLGAVSLGSLWNVRGHLQQASALATANYPETLDSIFIVNSPSFFPTVWGWIKVDQFNIFNMLWSNLMSHL